MAGRNGLQLPYDSVDQATRIRLGLDSKARIEWRDAVVREGRRTTVDSHGRTVEMSLSRGCMSCHTNKQEFCDACHNYLAVAPYCWDCHVEPPRRT